jgi:hypothetical protein
MKIYGLLFLVGLLGSPTVAIAQVTPTAPSSATIGETIALQRGATVQLYPGRNSTINFRNGEVMTSIVLSDPTFVLFTPNAELDSGKAVTLILRLSNGINFPRLSRSAKPNITITTVDQEGSQNTYTLDLAIASGSPRSEQTAALSIVPDDEALIGIDNTIQTPKGQATLIHIRRGLRIAIQQGFTGRSDPIVEQVRTLLAMAENGGSLAQLARQQGVSIQVLATLAELGLSTTPRALRDTRRGSTSPSPPLTQNGDRL